MTRPTISDISPRARAQVLAQLRETPHPRTLQLAEAPDPWRTEKRRKAKRGPSLAVVAAHFTAHGIAAPVAELRFDAVRRWRFDYAWPAERVALEVQGAIFTQGRHTRGAQLLAEWDKLNAAAAQGWRVLFCQPADLLKASTARSVRAALEWRASP